jgi:hypothetical protein
LASLVPRAATLSGERGLKLAPAHPEHDLPPLCARPVRVEVGDDAPSSPIAGSARRPARPEVSRLGRRFAVGRDDKGLLQGRRATVHNTRADDGMALEFLGQCLQEGAAVERMDRSAAAAWTAAKSASDRASGMGGKAPGGLRQRWRREACNFKRPARTMSGAWTSEVRGTRYG